MGALMGLFGGGGGGGLSLSNKSSADTGAQETGSSATGNQTGAINVLSPGAGTSSLSLGATGVIVLALVALVGLIFMIRGI